MLQCFDIFSTAGKNDELIFFLFIINTLCTLIVTRSHFSFGIPMIVKQQYFQLSLLLNVLQCFLRLIFIDILNIEGRLHKRTALTLQEKMELIRDGECGMPIRNLVMKYKCGRSQVHTILKNKAKIKLKWSQTANKNMKRKSSLQYQEINDLTLAWLESAQKEGLPVNGAIIREKARYFATTLKVDNFRASCGWLSKFCNRNNINLRGTAESSKQWQ